MPFASAQQRSRDPLKDIQRALPFGARHEGQVIEAWHQICIDQGCEFAVQTKVSAMVGGEGGMFAVAASIAPDVHLFRRIATDLSATPIVAGTKHFKHPDVK